MSIVAKVSFKTYRESVALALDMVDAPRILPEDRLIILKPNLTNDSPPPVTTDAGAVEAVYLYCREHTDTEIAIGEGSGSGTTQASYERNGYTKLARKHGIRLIDFNTGPAVLSERNDTIHLNTFHIPAVAVNAFVISIPVLKDHCFTTTTIAMKNMFGLAPAPFYRGSWNKSALHSPSSDQSVVDVCTHKAPAISVVDASVALTGMHLSGTPKRFNTILASTDPVAVDTEGSIMLGHEPESIEYLRLADNKLGNMTNYEVVSQ